MHSLADRISRWVDLERLQRRYLFGWWRRKRLAAIGLAHQQRQAEGFVRGLRLVEVYVPEHELADLEHGVGFSGVLQLAPIDPSTSTYALRLHQLDATPGDA